MPSAVVVAERVFSVPKPFPAESIGRRIAEHRKARGMSQCEIARKVGIWPKSLSNIERGIVNPRVRTILPIIAALGGGSRVANNATIPGRRIRLLREIHLLTQLECARLVGASRDQISEWERGDVVPSLPALRRVGDAFGVSLDYFLWQRNADEPIARQHAAAMKNIGVIIRRLCDERGLSLSEVERRAGLGARSTSKSHLSQIIAGRKKPLGRTLARLARVFGAGALTRRRVGLESQLRASRRGRVAAEPKLPAQLFRDREFQRNAAQLDAAIGNHIRQLRRTKAQ